jgi:hypothetical protein
VNGTTKTATVSILIKKARKVCLDLYNRESRVNTQNLMVMKYKFYVKKYNFVVFLTIHAWCNLKSRFLPALEKKISQTMHLTLSRPDCCRPVSTAES